MVICRSRRAVATWTRALRRLDLQACTQAFSGAFKRRPRRVQAQPLVALDEAEVVVVCGKLEAGYDDPLLACLVVDRHVGSPARLVQIYSRVNRASPNKPFPRVVDFANGADFVAFAFRRFWRGKSWTSGTGRGSAPRRSARSRISTPPAPRTWTRRELHHVATVLGADAAAALGADAAVVAASKDEACPEFPAAYARRSLPPRSATSAREGRADGGHVRAPRNVPSVGAVVGGTVSSLAVEAVASLPTHGGAGPALRPRRVARGPYETSGARAPRVRASERDVGPFRSAGRGVEARRAQAPRRVSPSTTPPRSQAKGVGRAAAALKDPGRLAVAALARRVVSEAKKRVAAALPPPGRDPAREARLASALGGLPFKTLAAAVARRRPKQARGGGPRAHCRSQTQRRDCERASRRARSRRQRFEWAPTTDAARTGSARPRRPSSKRRSSPRATCADVRLDTRDPQYGVAADARARASEFRQIQRSLDCLDCGRSWQEDPACA